MTEAALALQFVAEQGGLEGLVERFGTISPSGVRLDPPSALKAQVFEGAIEGGSISLYISRLCKPADWFGLLFFERTRRWLRLEGVTWQPETRRLRFRHPDPSGGGEVRYESTEAAGVLTGTVQFPEGSATWTAAVQPVAGLWTAPALVRALHLRRLEGEFGGWQGKLLPYGDKQLWRPLEDMRWDGVSALSFEVPGWGGFDGTVAQDVLAGTLRYTSAGAMISAPWSAQRAATGLPF
jgi:hypothetical protein